VNAKKNRGFEEQNIHDEGRVKSGSYNERLSHEVHGVPKQEIIANQHEVLHNQATKAIPVVDIVDFKNRVQNYENQNVLHDRSINAEAINFNESVVVDAKPIIELEIAKTEPLNSLNL